MKINLCKKIAMLIVVVFTFSSNTWGAVNKAENPYEVPLHEYSKRGSTQWRKDFDKQDVIAAINHIHYLLEDTDDSMDYLVTEELNEVYEQLQEIKDKLFDSGTYELVEIFLALLPENKDGRKYLAPFVIQVYGATPKDGPKIYIY